MSKEKKLLEHPHSIITVIDFIDTNNINENNCNTNLVWVSKVWLHCTTKRVGGQQTNTIKAHKDELSG